MEGSSLLGRDQPDLRRSKRRRRQAAFLVAVGTTLSAAATLSTTFVRPHGSAAALATSTALAASAGSTAPSATPSAVNASASPTTSPPPTTALHRAIASGHEIDDDNHTACGAYETTQCVPRRARPSFVLSSATP